MIHSRIRSAFPVSLLFAAIAFGQQDPGARQGPSRAGQPLPALTASELAVFLAGQDSFLDKEGVADGLGPRFNLDSCAGCHSHPTTGGSSPTVNPQIALASM